MFGIGKKNTAVSTVKINYDGKEASRGIKNLDKSFKLLAGSIGGLFALAKVNSFLVESSTLAKRQIQAEKGLSQALGKTSHELLNHASALQKNTTFGDEAIIEAQTLVAAFIKEEAQIKKLTPAILDLAAAKGMDLRSAADLVTKSVASSTNALSRYGIQIDGAAGSTERIDNAVGEITKAFGGMSEALAQTDVGKLEQMANELGDIQEQIGKEIIPLQVEWNKLLLSGTKIATNFFIETIAGWKAILKLNKDNTEESDESYEKIKKYTQEIKLWEEAVRNASGEFVKSPFRGRNIRLTTAEKHIENLKNKIIETNKEYQKIVSDPVQTAVTTDVMEPKRPQKTKKQKITVETLAVYEGFAEGLEQRERMLEEAEKRELQLEEEYIEQRKQAWNRLNEIGKSGTELRLQEEFAIIEQWRQQEVITAEEHERLKTDIEKRQSDERIRNKQKEEAEKRAIAQQGLSSMSTINNAIIGIINIRTNKEIESLEKLGLSEEDFARQKEAILQESEDKRRAFARAQQVIAIAEAGVNIGKAAAGAFADTPGPIWTRSLAMAAAFAQGALTVAQIEAQNFQTGMIGIDGIKRSRQKDTIPINIGGGESVISAPQTAMHEDTLRAIQNNTANTARGLNRTNSSIINNFYGVSSEQMLEAQINTGRRKTIGRKL